MKRLKHYLAFIILSFFSLNTYSQSEPIDIKLKIPWFSKKVLTYSLEKGDTIHINFTGTEKTKSKPAFGEYIDTKKLGDASQKRIEASESVQDNETLKSASKNKDIASIVKIKELNKAKNKISEFTFFKQGAGPLFQESKLSSLSKSFVIPQSGNYSLKFKNKTITPTYFQISIKISKPIILKEKPLNSLNFDTTSIVLLKKEISLDPKKDLNGNSEFIIPLDYETQSPALLGLSYLVTTNLNLIQAVEEGKAGTFDPNEASLSFNFKKDDFPSANDEDLYFNLISGNKSIIRNPDHNFVGTFKASKFNKNALSLYLNNESDVRIIKAYVNIILYFLEIKKNKDESKKGK